MRPRTGRRSPSSTRGRDFLGTAERRRRESPHDRVEEELTHAAYAKRIDDLLALDLQVDAGGDPEPVALPLSPDAQREWIDFFDLFAERQGNTVGDEAAALAKLVSYAARFALVHQLVREPLATVVGAEAVRAGATLCAWFADEAARGDVLIGCIAALPGLTVVTNHVRHFRPIGELLGIGIENWAEARTTE